MSDTNVRNITDWRGDYDGVALVFKDGEAVRVTRLLAHDGWEIQGGRTRVIDHSNGILVGPKNGSPHIQVQSRRSNETGHVVYQLASEDSGFAVLPTLLFQILEGRTRCANSGEKLLPSDGKSLFVAASLLERWLRTDAAGFVKECDVQYLTVHLRDQLNEIAAILEWLHTADGLMSAALTVRRTNNVLRCLLSDD